MPMLRQYRGLSWRSEVAASWSAVGCWGSCAVVCCASWSAVGVTSPPAW
jgi:hypothetical protein